MTPDLKKFCLAGTALSFAFLAEPAMANSVTFEGSTFTSQGLVGVARVPSNARDKYGETLGGIGSAMAVIPNSWKKNKDGSYSGILVGVPDRGWNTQGTLDFRGRTQRFKIRLTPFYGAQTNAQDQLQMDYKHLTALHYVRPTTGEDAIKVIQGYGNFPDMPAGGNGRLSVDNEGIAFQGDGTFWVSDEYGPYVYHYAASGKLLNVIRPPEAFIPRRLDSHGNPVENFSANAPGIGESYNLGNPVSGRQNNQGMEGLSISADHTKLYVLLQSALIQDTKVTDISHTRRNTRLLEYSITDTLHPQLIHEYAVQLPTYTNGTGNANLVAAQSELHAINDHQFMVLARDSSVGETFPATPD
ncbi:MAG TPA: esterase-like activity of phytase family protein, partial [Rhizomicrobium sp.]|nr:esterase-like activity of phytase family protein [Rhizomicrobium sp.]